MACAYSTSETVPDMRQIQPLIDTKVSPVVIFACAGNRDPVSEAALAAAFDKGGWQKITRLYRSDDIPPERCWVRAPGWCLAYS